MANYNKFLHQASSTSGNLTNGTQYIFGSEIGAINLNPGQPVKANAQRQLISSKLDIDDINNLQTALDGSISNPIVGDLDMSTNNIINVNLVDGVDVSLLSTDVTNLQNDKLSIDGTNSMSANLDLGTNNIINVVDPVNPQDVATKNYTDTNTANNNYLLKSGGTMGGSIDYAALDMTTVGRILNTTSGAYARRVIIGNGTVNAGAYGISLGEDAGEGTTANNVISIGRGSGRNKGTGTISIGVEAGSSSGACTRMVCIGASAAKFGDNDDTVIIGQSSVGKGFGSVVIGCDAVNDNAAHAECVVIGCAASSTATNEITLQASAANIIKATPTTITHQGNSIAGDIKSDGTVAMTADLDAGTNKVVSVVDPTVAQDAATKNYVDTATVNTNYLLKTGGTMTGKIGDLQTTDTKIRLGNLSGVTGQASNAIAIGTNAGNLTQNQDSIAIGNTCGQISQGAFSVGVGLSCANANQGQQCVALGYNSQNSGSNNNSTALGARSGETNQHSKSICINANTSALNSTAEDQMKLKAGVTEFTYDVNGFVIANNVDTIGSAEGSLRTLGGITSTKNMYCGANLYVIGDVKTNLTMDNNSITNVNLVDGVDVSLLSTNVGTNTTDITNLQNDKLNKDGTIIMTGNLDLGTNNIINVVDPVNPQDVVTKNYNDTINTIIPTGGYLDIYGGLYVGSLTHRRPIMSSGYTMITDGDIVIAAIAPTSLLTNSTGLGSLTVPANVMKVGSTSHWTMSGNIESGTNAETLNIYFYSGATQILSKTFNLATKIDAGSSFRFVGDVVCRTIGGVGVGEIYTIGQLSVGTTNQAQSITVNVSQLSNIDTTVSNTFDVRCSYGSADLANRIQARHLTNYNVYQPP